MDGNKREEEPEDNPETVEFLLGLARDDLQELRESWKELLKRINALIYFLVASIPWLIKEQKGSGGWWNCFCFVMLIGAFIALLYAIHKLWLPQKRGAEGEEEKEEDCVRFSKSTAKNKDSVQKDILEATEANINEMNKDIENRKKRFGCLLTLLAIYTVIMFFICKFGHLFFTPFWIGTV